MFLEREQICQLCHDVSAKFPFHCVTSRPISVLLVHCAQKECAFSVLILRKGVFYSQCTQIHAHIHTLYYTHMQRIGAIRKWVCFGASFWNVSATGQKDPGCQHCQLAKSVKQLYLWRPIKLSPLYSVVSFVSFITHKFSHSIQRNGFWGLNCVSIWFYHCLKWGQSGPQCGHHIYYPCCIELQIYFWEWRLIGTGLLWSLL